MARHRVTVRVEGPWSLAASRRFWEGFTPAALPDQTDERLHTAFCADADWSTVRATITQHDDDTSIQVEGDGDLDAAAEQVRRLLAIDVDGSAWPKIGRADPVIGAAQAEQPGLRPCGFHSPYEAAAWSVLSQRVRMMQAATLSARLIEQLGAHGAFPPPAVLRRAELDLPGRKPEYLQAVADAALDGVLDGLALRALDPDEAMARVGQVKGLGPFASELVVLRGANAPDGLPGHEARLEAIIADRYGAGADLQTVAEAWRPLRTWGSFLLRATSGG